MYHSRLVSVVSDSESDDSTNDSLDKDKMLTGLLHEIIAEHKQEQADWNNYIKRWANARAGQHA